jgi:hypothetical protein
MLVHLGEGGQLLPGVRVELVGIPEVNLTIGGDRNEAGLGKHLVCLRIGH